MGITIRPWQKNDLSSIREVTWKSWISTYSNFLPESDLKSYFDSHYTEESMLGMFYDSSMHAFIAEKDNRIAGYARLFFNQDENRMYVASLYFLPEFTGQGLGRQLLEAAEGYAREKGADRLWIGVMVKNRRALLFYKKAGFHFIYDEPFTMGKTTVSHFIGFKRIGRNAFLDQKIYARFDGKKGSKNLSALCLKLLSEQKKSWPDLREGYKLLKKVKERSLSCNGFSVRLQYNPGRIKSSMADIGRTRIKTGRCFLCTDHLPEDQKGILYRNDTLILCNPMPVFPSHFILSHVDHCPQDFSEHMNTFFQLMADLGSGWASLYNGPRCGASAPDHLHFQAIPSKQLPVEKEIQKKKRLVLISQTDGISLSRVKGLGREVLLLEGNNPAKIEEVFKNYLNGMKRALLISKAENGNLGSEGSLDEEPMLNMVGFYKKGRWRLLIFPRRKHRPDCFFKKGDSRIVVSPGAIDMAGVLITPVEKDFKRLNADSVKDIYKEVSLVESGK